MFFRRKGNGIVHEFNMDVILVFRFTEKFRGGVQWHKMESKDFISKIFFGLRMKTENQYLSTVKAFPSDYELRKIGSRQLC